MNSLYTHGIAVDSVGYVDTHTHKFTASIFTEVTAYV